MSDGQEIKARHQRAGYLWKLPMSKCVGRAGGLGWHWRPAGARAPRENAVHCFAAAWTLTRLLSSPRAACRTSSEKWQKRVFIAKDGFLLYYGEKTNPNAPHFDTKPKVSRRRRRAGRPRRWRVRGGPRTTARPPSRHPRARVGCLQPCQRGHAAGVRAAAQWGL
jgi:hypothetical protein